MSWRSHVRTSLVYLVSIVAGFVKPGSDVVVLRRDSGRDRDAFDPLMDHLIVIDHARSPAEGQVVGNYRLLRRDRPAIAAAMIAFFLYGGMLLTVLPHEPGVSWQAHLGGALAGILAAVLFRRSDPMAPRRRYSWELEEDARQATDVDDEMEPPRPSEVPVLWQRPPPPPGRVVVRLPNRH